jgi:cobalt-zinc-cadmium efflux system outer membrane protein
MKAVCLLTGAAAAAMAQTPQMTVTINRHLTLPQAESLLLQRNLGIAVNRSMLEAAEAAKLIASYKPNPTIQMGAEQYPVQSPLSGSVPRLFTTDSNAGAQPTYTFLFTKMVERGGKRTFRTQQAEAQVRAARAQILDTFRQQLLQLRQAFGSALLARRNLEFARQALREYEQTEKLTETRVKSGDAAQVELYRVRTGKFPYQQAVVQAQTAYQQACLDVLNLLNSRREEVVMTPAPAGEDEALRDAPLDVEGDFADGQLSLTLEDLKKVALRERPDVGMARYTLEAAQFGASLARAQRARDLTFGLEYQRVGSDSAVGFTASFPLFLYNNQRAAISEAAAVRRAAELLSRQAELQAITDTEKAWWSYQAAQRSAAVFSRENLDQAEKLRRVAFFSFQHGATSLFELLDAQRTLNQARTGFNQARFDVQNSLWLLEAAIGRALEGAKP